MKHLTLEQKHQMVALKACGPKQKEIAQQLTVSPSTVSRTLLLKSLNPLYEPYEVPMKEIVEVWKFVHYISNELPEPGLPRDEIVSSLLKLHAEVDILKRKAASA